MWNLQKNSFNLDKFWLKLKILWCSGSFYCGLIWKCCIILFGIIIIQTFYSVLHRTLKIYSLLCHNTVTSSAPKDKISKINNQAQNSLKVIQNQYRKNISQPESIPYYKKLQKTWAIDYLKYFEGAHFFCWQNNISFLW